MTVNFSSTTPAAPSGRQLVHWQHDTGGNISGDIPDVLSGIELTGQAADIASTPLYAVPAGKPGLYLVMAVIALTQAATSSSTLPSLVISWTDKISNTVQTRTIAAASPSANLLTTQAGDALSINVKDGTNINYSTTGYASSGATPMQFAVALNVS